MEDYLGPKLPRTLQIFLVFFFGICMSVFGQADQHFSLRNTQLQADERVLGIELEMKAGSFISIEAIPAGWFMTIDNDPSWQTVVKGNAKVGAAALGASDLQKLDFYIHKYEFGDLHFALSGTLIVTKDFEHERLVPLTPEDFLIKSNRR